MTDTGPRFDPANPLAAIDGETVRANQALADFWGMGPGRTLEELAERYAQENRARPHRAQAAPRPPTTAKHQKTARNQLSTWSSAHQWQARIKAQAALEAARLAEIMLERRAEVLARQYEIGQQMIELGQEGLRQGQQFTSTTRRFIKGKDGQPDREIITVRMDARAVVQMADTGIKLTRDATGLDSKAAGTEADPIHTVTESREEWERRAAERAAAAAATLAEFADEPDGAK